MGLPLASDNARAANEPVRREICEGLRQLGTLRRTVKISLLKKLALSDTKVENLRDFAIVVRRQVDIVRLQVAMHNPVIMRAIDRGFDQLDGNERI